MLRESAKGQDSAHAFLLLQEQGVMVLGEIYSRVCLLEVSADQGASPAASQESRQSLVQYSETWSVPIFTVQGNKEISAVQI